MLSESATLVVALGATVVLTTVVASMVYGYITRYMRRRRYREMDVYERHLFLELTRRRRERKEEEARVDVRSERLEEIVEEKRRKFLSVPSVAFHFVNADQVRSFYNDYFREPTVESLVSEIVGEVSGEIKGTIPQILESRLGGKNLTKWISSIKLPDIPLHGMFQRYQRETIKNEQVTLGIEEVDIELSKLEEFDDAIEELGGQFGLKLDDDMLENQRRILKEKAAETTLVKLETAAGWVLVEGRFKIQEEGDFYRCTHLHPVNEYLSERIGPVTISVLVRKDSLEPHIAGNYAQSIGSLVPLRIYGQVWQPIHRAADTWELSLTPLAIY